MLGGASSNKVMGFLWGGWEKTLLPERKYKKGSH
jgi:hypothetical protein